ncbi:flocculation protein FLO11 [Lingula anatina]|uniref:Flocculation protein FLO11 n=1 Tax=Lingula anatina TaxID=7574 RepID=A0A1S3HCC5_LINAN|nr:flocculation protein FLO11 [Lingula anatina]|eukprot:XP_013383663.1 flocculation protein FLO11 [Lingula anatina]
MAQSTGSHRRSLNKVIIKQGYLRKAPTSSKLPLIKSWDKKWVVFGVLNGEDAYLEYFDTQSEIFRGTPCAVVNLQNIKHITYTMQGQKYDFEFHIGLQDRVVTLVADSRNEMFAWCDALNLKLRELHLIGRKENDYMAIPRNLPRPQPENSQSTEPPASAAANNVAPRRPPPPLPQEAEVPPRSPSPLDADFNPRGQSPLRTDDNQSQLTPQLGESRNGRTGDVEDVIDSIIREHEMQKQGRNSVADHNSHGTSSVFASLEEEEDTDSDYEDNLLLEEETNHLMAQNYGDELQTQQHPSTDQSCTPEAETPAVNQVSAAKISKAIPHPRHASSMENSVSADQVTDGSNSVTSGSSRDTNVSSFSGAVAPARSYHESNGANTYEALWEVPLPVHSMKTSVSAPDSAFSDQPDVIPPIPRRRTKIPSQSHPPPPVPPSSFQRSASCPGPPDTYTCMASPDRQTSGFEQTAGNNLQNSPNIADEVDMRLARKLRELEGPEVNYGPGGPPPLEEAPPPYTPPRSAYMPGMIPVRTAGQSPTGGATSPLSPHSLGSPSSRMPPLASSISENAPPPLPARTHSQVSRRSVPSPEGPGPLPPRRLHRGISLKESQVQILKNEMAMQGVSIALRKSDCLGSIALVDCFGTVWVAGWNMRDRPSLHNAFHIGDNILSINDQVIHSAQAAQKAIKHCDDYYKVNFLIRRLPHGRVFAIRRSAEGESLGIKREGGTAEIVRVDQDGLAAQHGLPAMAKSIDGTTLCNWSLTEINNRPLNLFFKDNEIEHRLNAVGKDISLLVQPYDFIKALKKALKSLKNYKDYIVQ